MHRPDTSAPMQWIAIHLIHPFNVLALVVGLVEAPQSCIARLLSSPPLLALADLSYAIYLIHSAVIIFYVFTFDKRWEGMWEALIASPGAEPLGTHDYACIVVLSVALAYPVTHWIEPSVARLLEARVGATTAATLPYNAV